MRFASTEATLDPVSFLGILLLAWSLLLVAAMIVGVAGPLTAPARNR